MNESLARAKNAASEQYDNAAHMVDGYAHSIEDRVTDVDADKFLLAAVASVGLSLALNLFGKKEQANFVGHWAPTLLIFGLYAKLTKDR